MFIALLGRQPEISLAELMAVFGDKNVTRISRQFARIASREFDIDTLGGTIKYGRIIKEKTLPTTIHDTALIRLVSQLIQDIYVQKWQHHHGKITLGISAYGLTTSPREIQKIGLTLKSTLKQHSVSMRLIPNDKPALSTASSHNNRLGTAEHKVELMIIRTSQQLIIAESRGVQNITAYTQRDRQRPKRDAFVGMLPPKLAQIMINLSGAQSTDYLWDPFCGTGTILQEARMMGIAVHGSDLSQRMVNYTTANMRWLDKKLFRRHDPRKAPRWTVCQADATSVSLTQNQISGITHIVCETYLGQPFSAPPSPAKRDAVVKNCNYIIRAFLQNIHNQITPQTTLCIAVPAWRDQHGNFTHLPLLNTLTQLGYTRLNTTSLLYYRPNQIVARELLVLKPFRT